MLFLSISFLLKQLLMPITLSTVNCDLHYLISTFHSVSLSTLQLSSYTEKHPNFPTFCPCPQILICMLRLLLLFKSGQGNQSSVTLDITGTYILVIKVIDGIFNYKNDCKAVSESSNKALQDCFTNTFPNIFPILPKAACGIHALVPCFILGSKQMRKREVREKMKPEVRLVSRIHP